MANAVTRLAASCLVATLAACGGGGGGGTPGLGEPTAPSGLIPPEPALGAILYPDASVLRPMRDGATWTYRGVQTPGGGSPIVYDDVVSHQAGAAGAVDETGTNPYNGGPESVTLSTAGGTVRTQTSLEIVPGHVQMVDDIELRSPVRIGDQYTSLDQEMSDGGLDVDGDGRNDAFAMAVYRRVIGQESVSLPHIPSIEAVHVRTYVLGRYRRSATGTYTDTASATLDLWYAPNIGVVKMSLDALMDSSGRRVSTTETLVAWDGVDTGLGALPTRRLTSGIDWPAGAVVSTAGFGTHALTLGLSGSFAAHGMTLKAIDARGSVIGTHTYTDPWAAGVVLVRVGDQARVVSLQNSGFEMFSYTSLGAATGAPKVHLAEVPAPTGRGEPFAAASSGNVVWLAWVRYPTGGSNAYRLVLQGFDAQGNAVTPIHTLASADSQVAYENLRFSSGGGRAALAWNQNAAGLWSTRYVLLTDSTTLPMVLEAGPRGDPDLTVAAASHGHALLWPRAQAQLTGGIGAVALDSSGTILRTTTGALDTEVLALPWFSQPMSLITHADNHIDALVQDNVKLWPDQQSSSVICILTELTAGPTSTALSTSARLLYRSPCSASSLVSLEKAVLLLSNSPDGLSVTPVWRRQ
jgi:hypothetical protein